MFRKVLVAILLVLLPGSARAQSASPGFREYQALLDQYVHRITENGRLVDTRFDYEQLYVDENIWKLHRSARLERLHTLLLDAKPSAMTPRERLVWGINTYNFLVIERVTAYLLIPGRKFMRYKRADEIVTPQGGMYTSFIANVEGRDYMLDGFLRRFVYGDSSTTGVRPKLEDVRLLFATNSGCIGEPPLMPRAYRADSLDHQLELATRTAMALPRFVTVVPNPPQLRVSDWLGRNLGDFAGGEPGLLTFIQKYAPRTIRDALKQEKLTRVSAYLPLNMLLNQKEHPKVAMPDLGDGDGGTL
jgi:hypothetical protein